MNRLRLASWNINSIRLRLPLLKKLVETCAPDVIALQETKCPDELLPLHELHALGYSHVHYSGMKSYNGVLLMSRLPLHDTHIHVRVDKQDCRHIEAALLLPDRKLVLHNLYIPAGGDIPDEQQNVKFAHKLDFVREMARFFPQRYDGKDSLVALGDFNIAPYEHDVWSHRQLLNVVSHTPIEVDLLEQMRKAHHWVDVARHVVPADQKLYTWWSYRNHDWKKSDRGRRLDHIWVTPDLVPAIAGFQVVREARDWEKPSDHVPVFLDLAL